MVFLTSTGFTNPKVYSLLDKKAYKKIESACIITTAATPLKEKHPIAVKTYNYLSGKEITRIKYLDIEVENSDKILDYDLVFILGGNSCHLFTHIKKSGADKIILEMARRKKNIIGASAGAMLLSSGNKYTKEFGNIIGIDEDMPENFDSEGLKFTDHILFPHYDMFKENIPNLENKLISIEQKYDIDITRLKNMDFICVDNEGLITTGVE